MKLVKLATAAAVAINAVVPAYATTSLPSWEDAIKDHKERVEAGKFSGYTLGIHSNVIFKPLAGADGFIFGNILADDVPLPRVTNVTKVLEAAKDKNKPIVVASEGLILPSNAMLCEIANQVKMECGDFTKQFYMHTMKDEDGNFIGEEAAYDNLLVIQEELITQLEAMDLEIHTENPVVKALKEQIANLKANPVTAQSDLIDELQKTLDIIDENFGTEVDLTLINEVLSDVNAHYETMKQKYIDEAEAHAQTIQNHIDLLASYRNSMIAAGVPVNADVQTMINSLVVMRDIALDKAAYWKTSSETWEASSNDWQDKADAWEKAANDYAASAEMWKDAFDKELKAHEALKIAHKNLKADLASTQAALASAQSQNANLSNANSDNATEIQNLKNKISELEATIEGLENAEVVIVEKIVEVEKIVYVDNSGPDTTPFDQSDIDAAVDQVTIDQNAVYVGYTDNSVTFKVGASNGKSMTFTVTTTDFTENGFHLEFNNGGNGNFELDILAQAYKDFVASLGGNGGEFTQADIDAAVAGKEIDYTVFKYGCDGYCGNAYGPGWMLESGGKVKIYLKDGTKAYIDLWGEAGSKGVTDYLAGEFEKHLANKSTATYSNGTLTVTMNANEINVVKDFHIVEIQTVLSQAELVAKMTGPYSGSSYDYLSVGKNNSITLTFNSGSEGSWITGVNDPDAVLDWSEIHIDEITIADINEIINAVYDKGYSDGYHDGFDAGYTQGYKDAYKTIENQID